MTWLLPAIGFALLWIWVFYREDKNPEPLWMVTLAFLLGTVAFGITWAIERYVAWNWEGFKSDSLLDNAILALLIVGPTEEGSKFMVVRAFIYKSPHFDEPMDGIIYSVVVATGFAFAENLLLTFDAKHLIWLRGLCGTLVHILFASYWGAALGWAKIQKPTKLITKPLMLSLIVSSLLHGLFDLCIFVCGRQLSVTATRLILMALVIVSFFILRHQMKRTSPKRNGTNL